MKKNNFLLLSVAVLLLASCDKDPEFVENVPDLPNQNYGLMSDHEGKQYNTIRVGQQKWMLTGMRATTLKDGKSIYKNDESVSDTLPMCYRKSNSYGIEATYYNYEAAKHICPNGWRLPKSEDWNELIEYVDENKPDTYYGDLITIAKALASRHQVWKSSNEIGTSGYHRATNDYFSFYANPLGYINTTDSFALVNLKYKAACWSQSSASEEGGYAYSYDLDYDKTVVNITKHPLSDGLIVRCIKE